MGCSLSKLFSSSGNHEQLSEGDVDDETPKVYSWEKREKIDSSNFLLDKLTNDVVGRMPGTINGQQFIIQNCENCDIYVFDHCATVTVDDCNNCRIFIAAIKSSIFIRDCNNCVIATCCQQFRTRDCKKIDAFICCVTQPIIESTTSVKFGCFQFHYPQLTDHLRASGLSTFNNNWSDIHDFTPVPDENNYTFMKRSTVATDLLPLPTKEPLSSIEMTADESKSVIPFTVGVKQRPLGHGCLVTIFSDEQQLVLANSAIQQLRELSLVQTAELSLSEEQVKRIFVSETYLSKASRGPVIMLEYSVHDIDECKAIVQAMNRPDCLHVSDSVESAAREIECFNNLTEMQMAV